MTSAHLVRRRGRRRRRRLAEARAVLGAGVLEGVDDRQRLLAVGEVRRLLAGRLLRAPDPEQVVVELEGEPERPAEAAVAGDDRPRRRWPAARRPRSRPRSAPRSCARSCRSRARRVIELVRARSSRCRCTGPRTGRGRSRRTGASGAAPSRPEKPEVGQPMERDPRQAEQRVAGVDRLRDAVDGPQRRPVASLDVAVLDVVVDEAEVVAELHGRGAGQGALVLAGDDWRRRAGPSSGRIRLPPDAPEPSSAEVVADHLVQAVGRRVAVARRGGRSRASVSAMRAARSMSGDVGRHRGASVHETCTAQVAC